MVDQEQVYRRLQEIFQEVFDDDAIQVTPELSAAQVEGWDSLTHIRLIVTIERAFSVKFTTSEIGKLQNVRDLAQLIELRTSKPR